MTAHHLGSYFVGSPLPSTLLAEYSQHNGSVAHNAFDHRKAGGSLNQNKNSKI